MTRLLGLILVLGLGWLIVRAMLGKGRLGRPVRRDPPRFEKTVRCRRCGAHMPLALARPDGDGHVCDDPGCNPDRTREADRDE